MVNSMQQEVHGQSNGVIREVVVDVEEEPVQQVLQESPDQVADEEAYRGLNERREGNGSYRDELQRGERVREERRERVVAEGELQGGAKIHVRSDG